MDADGSSLSSRLAWSSSKPLSKIVHHSAIVLADVSAERVVWWEETDEAASVLLAVSNVQRRFSVELTAHFLLGMAVGIESLSSLSSTMVEGTRWHLDDERVEHGRD